MSGLQSLDNTWLNAMTPTEVEIMLQLLAASLQILDIGFMDSTINALLTRSDQGQELVTSPQGCWGRGSRTKSYGAARG